MGLATTKNLYLTNRNLLRASNADLLINSSVTVLATGNATTQTSALASTGSALLPDHFISGATAGTGTMGITADAPAFSDCGIGAKYCFEVKCTVTTASVTASLYHFIGSVIDQVDAAMLSGGSFTYSFWAKTNVAMTFSLRFAWNGTTQQMMSVPFTTNNTATWQKYTFTLATPNAIAGSSSSAAGLTIKLYLMAGTNAQTSSDNAWITYDSTKGASTTQSNFFSSTSNYLRLCLLQCEKGKVALPFEYRTRAKELELLMPWIEWTDRRATYALAAQVAATTMRAPINFLARKIAAPTILLWDTTPTANQLLWYATNNTSTGRATTAQSITTTGFYAQQTAAVNYLVQGFWRADARASLFNF